MVVRGEALDDRPLEGIRALTTDPERRIGLYAIRYLGRAGAVVTAAGRKSMAQAVGFRSKYVNRRVFLSDDYYTDLASFIRRNHEEYDLVNPIEVASMLRVLNVAKESGIDCEFLIPDKQSLVLADSKEQLTKHAGEIGIECPKTFYEVPPEEIRDLGRHGLTFPCIVKFCKDTRSTNWDPGDRYSIVASSDELESEYRRMHAIEPFPMIQELIRGGGFGYFALFDKMGNLKAEFCHRRIREYPVDGGPSSCCESFYDTELIRIGRRLFHSLEWKGLGMVEFKFDEIHNRYVVLEINPRYWGSLPLAAYSGINFPVLHALSALGVDYTPVLSYKIGVRTRFLINDSKAIWQKMARERSWRGKGRLLLELLDLRYREGLITADDLFALFRHVNLRG